VAAHAAKKGTSCASASVSRTRCVRECDSELGRQRSIVADVVSRFVADDALRQAPQRRRLHKILSARGWLRSAPVDACSRLASATPMYLHQCDIVRHLRCNVNGLSAAVDRWSELVALVFELWHRRDSSALWSTRHCRQIARLSRAPSAFTCALTVQQRNMILFF